MCIRDRLNMLLGEDRAIVTEIAGTTRDALHETINLHGISLNMIDTAGDVYKRQSVRRLKDLLLNRLISCVHNFLSG